jgi:hypothetical protein
MVDAYPRTVLTEFRVLLDDVTVARLMEIADAAHALPEAIIACIIHDVCEDDWHAHLAESSSGVSVH